MDLVSHFSDTAFLAKLDRMAVRWHADIHGGDEGLRHHLCFHHGEHMPEGTPRQEMEDKHEEEHEWVPPDRHRGEYTCPDMEHDEENELHSDIGDIHRGIGVRLPDELHRLVHDPSRPEHERAGALLDHLKEHESGIGVHWTTEPGVAEDFAEHAARHESAEDKAGTAVVFHANPPERDHIDTAIYSDPSVYGYHDHGEREVPLIHGDYAGLKGVSWAPMHYDEDTPGHGEYTHHDLEAPQPHIAVTHAIEQDDYENPDKVYLRFGRWPENERSHNFAMGWDEEGVSTYDLDKHGEPKDPDPGGASRLHIHDESCEPGCDLDWMNENYGETSPADRVIRAERTRLHGNDNDSDTGHLVRGRFVGFGHDAEPLLNNVRRVGDWIDHRHLFIPGSQPHRLARSPEDEDYEAPEEAPGHALRQAAGGLVQHFEAAARPGRGEKTCKCCKGSGSHPDGSECDPCDGSGLLHSNESDTYCPGQPQPKRRHWRQPQAAIPGYEIRFDPDYHGRHAVTAWDREHGNPDAPDYDPPMGSLHWHPGTGVINYLVVPDRYQRHGIATALWNRAHEEADRHGLVPPAHSDSRTPAADAWAQSVGGAIPPLSAESQDPKWLATMPEESRFHQRREAAVSDVPPAERTESVRHILDNYLPSDGATWDEVRGNYLWDHPKMRSFVDDVRRNGVQRPVPIDYGQDPPRVENGHTRILAAERAGVETVPSRQFLGRGEDPDQPSHQEWREFWSRDGALEVPAGAGDEPSAQCKDLLGHFEGARDMIPSGQSPQDEWHGPYEVVQHPETKKFHVVDNQGRHATVLDAIHGHPTQEHAERSRDYIDQRRAGQERARALGETLWGGASEALDPGGTEESRESDRNIQAGEDLMGRYAGGRGQLKFDSDEEGGHPYYEREHYLGNGRSSGWYVRHYGGPQADVYHRATGDRSHGVIRFPQHPEDAGISMVPRIHPDFDDVDLGRALGSWHDNEEGGERQYLEHNVPQIQRWKKQHLGAVQAVEASGEYRSQHTAPHPDAGHLPLHHYTGEDPDEDVRIYRAAPAGTESINSGDWISLNPDYAHQHGRHATDPSKDWPVYTADVPQRHVHWDENDENEHGYNGPDIRHPDVHDEETGELHDWHQWHEDHPHGQEAWAGASAHLPQAEHDFVHDDSEWESDRADTLLSAARAQGSLRGARWRDDNYPAQDDAEEHAARHTPPEGHQVTSFYVHRGDSGRVEGLGIHHYHPDDPESRRYRYVSLEDQDYDHPAAGDVGTGSPHQASAEILAPQREYSAGRMLVSDIRRPGEGRLSEREYTQRQLAADIRRNGVQQPLAVEDLPAHGGPTVFNGLHRLDAAERAGVADVPVVVKHLPGKPPAMIQRVPASEQDFSDAYDIEREGRWAGEKTAAQAAPDPGAVDWPEVLRGLRYRKKNEPLMHRGMAVALPPELHDFVTDRMQTPSRQARAIAEHLRTQGLGTHWTTNEKVAREFSGFEQKKQPGTVKVMVHAKLPEPEHIETDRDKLMEGGVFRPDNFLAGEKEIPLRAGAPVRVTGITWYGYGNRKHYGDVGGPGGMEHLAVAGRGEGIPPEQFRDIPLYHGSNHVFQPGDMLTPEGGAPYSASWANIEHQPGRYVYTTRNPHAAEYAASHHPEFDGMAHVYQVEHTGPAEPDYIMEQQGVGGISYRTSHPVRVIKSADNWHEEQLGRYEAAAPEYGPRPEYVAAPEDASDDEKMAHFERQRAIKHDWERHITHGISTGRLSPEQARELGHYFPGEQTDHHGEPTWQPMPEQMYHVTTDLSGVRQHGLKSRSELGQERGGHGLGGGSDTTVSLTSSHATAVNILARMHEFHDVVNGRLTPAQMWDQAKRGENASRPFHGEVARQWDSRWKEGDPLPRGVDSALRGVETKSGGLLYSPAEMAERQGPGWRPHRHESDEFPGGDGVTRYNVWERDLDPDRRREQAADFYKTFSAWREHTGGPQDPLFFSTDTRAFAAKNPRNFGIVHVRPKPGAMGFPMGSLGEWRTETGDALDIRREPGTPRQARVLPSGMALTPQVREASRRAAAFIPQDEQEAREMIGDFPLFFAAFADGLNGLAGRLGDCPVDEVFPQAVVSMAKVCQGAAEDAERIISGALAAREEDSRA